MALLDERMRDELLLRLDERVHALVGRIEEVHADQACLKKKMESDEGYARCQVHRSEMSNLKNSFTWMKRTAIGAIITLAVKAFVDYFVIGK